MPLAIAAPALPAALVSSAPPVVTGKPGSSSEAAAVDSGSDVEACVRVDEVLCPVLRSDMQDFINGIQVSRSYSGVSALLLVALLYRVRVCVWYGIMREDVLEKYAPWVSGSITQEVAVEAVACSMTRDAATGAEIIHLLGEDIRETNHWVACVKSGECHGDGAVSYTHLTLPTTPYV